MNDPLKSAWELALEKLRDRGMGDGEERQFSDEQKARIAAVRQEFAARCAELRFGHEREVEVFDPSSPEGGEQLEKARAAFEAGLAALDEAEQDSIREIRAESGTP